MSTLSKQFNLRKTSTATKQVSFLLGQALGTLALEKNIKEVVCDCGLRRYHGRIESLAEGARLSGLVF